MTVFLFLFSFASPVVLNEVMANPKGSESGPGAPGDRNEFIELYNNSDQPVDLAGWQLTDFDATDDIIEWSDPKILVGYPKVIINSTILPARRYAVVLDPEYTSEDTTGGNVEPYVFSDSTLILTVGNTTLGDGLASTDPLLLYSPVSADSSSFGTPFDTLDSLPRDAGDGSSWERSRPDAADSTTAWMITLDPSGSTPGRANSTRDFVDIAIAPEDISFLPDPARAGQPVAIRTTVHNRGYSPVKSWQAVIFSDTDHDRMYDPTERLGLSVGLPLAGQADTVLEISWPDPVPGVNALGVEVIAPDDRDSTNNRAFATLNVYGAKDFLQVERSPFNPETDTAAIHYRLPEPGGSLVIAVYDLAGRPVATLVRISSARLEGEARWTGRSDGGRALPVGVYIVNLEYRAGARSCRAKLPVVIAKPL